MNTSDLVREIAATYERHGWTLRQVLLRPETKATIESASDLFRGAEVRDADFDAVWFSRPSHAKREAWELRLISPQAYALFEAFEADEAEEAEEDREEARREMENRMRQHVSKE